MRNPMGVFAVLIIVASPTLAEERCEDLCDTTFYATATAADVQQVLDQGVDPNTRDEVGKSALHWVAAARPEVIKALLAAGAEVNSKDQWDRTPLHFVAAKGSVENIQLLLDSGAEVNARTANDWTPIHGAAKFGSEDQIMVLLEAGADASARTEMGETTYDFGVANAKLKGTSALEFLQENR